MSSMSVHVEFTKTLPVSGVDTHVTVSFPGRLTVCVELDNWKLMAAWRPASSGPAGLTTLYHYHVRPFTALQVIGADLPVNPCPGESKDVHAFGVIPITVIFFPRIAQLQNKFNFGTPTASISDRGQVWIEIELEQSERATCRRKPSIYLARIARYNSHGRQFRSTSCFVASAILPRHTRSGCF